MSERCVACGRVRVAPGSYYEGTDALCACQWNDGVMATQRAIGMGTVFVSSSSVYAPRPSVPDPNEVRADEIIERWKNSKKGGWKKLRKLIIEALDEVSDE